MTTLRHRMLEDLQLRGLAPKTPQCYVAAVRQLAHYYRRPPDQLSDEELRQYFLYLRNEKKVAESTFRIHLYGIRFFYERTLTRPWPVFDLVRPRHPQKLPVVLSPREVRDLLAWVKNPTAQMCLRLIYACGLRLTEGTQLQVSDIDAQRMLVQVRCGKGGKDRCVPLAPRVLTLLREYWQRQRPRPWLFPARAQQTPLPATTAGPLLSRHLHRAPRARGGCPPSSTGSLRHPHPCHGASAYQARRGPTLCRRSDLSWIIENWLIRHFDTDVNITMS
jgi:integrase/recombinase XerD